MKIAIHSAGCTYYFMPEQILRLQAISNYTSIFFTNREKIVTSKVLKEYESLLEPVGFIRTHRTHLVNTRHILLVEQERKIVMNDLSEAGLSRRRKKTVLDTLKKIFIN